MGKIEHQVTICAIKNKKITLVISNQSCSSCAIASLCSLKSNKKIELNYDTSQKFTVNEKVILAISPRTEKMGILLLYMLPTLIVFASLLIGQYFQIADNICALAAIIAGGLYFLLLYKMKNRLKTDFEIIRENK